MLVRGMLRKSETVSLWPDIQSNFSRRRDWDLRRSPGGLEESRFADVALDVFCLLVLLTPTSVRKFVRWDLRRSTHDFQLGLGDFGVLLFPLAL
jgi:hypothetical protein